MNVDLDALSNQAWSLFIRALLVLLVVIVTWWISRRARATLRNALTRRDVAGSLVLLLDRAVMIGVWALGALVVLGILGLSWIALGGVTAALTLAITVAMQDVAKNFVAGVYLLIERPFEPGERVQIRSVEGVVETVDLRTTQVRTDDGDRVYIPNMLIFSNIVHRRHVFPPSSQDQPEQSA